MNDTLTAGAGLLRAVLEDPADDVVRLVYADWLEERGEDETTGRRAHGPALRWRRT